ncbi:MAG: DUF1810 domain-containing protein [Gammaproteobacteria bacterium]|nr:MAG: DUF1810 domain-containing protein [Gammaproteobacteria bacterium]
MSDPFSLQRFADAQEGVFAEVCAELAAGRKESHWMWFVFPQLKGLGSSATARHYAIGSLEEARAYLAHPVLGPRLRECTGLVNRIEGRSVEAIFGYPDHLKFRSCMTLFARAAETVTGAVGAHAPGHARSADETQPFREALEKYFAGEGDALTLQLLTSASGT